MTQKTNFPVCESCKGENLIEGTLEGVSFQPSFESAKWLSSGIYGIKAYVCQDCGHISGFSIDINELKSMLQKRKK